MIVYILIFLIAYANYYIFYNQWKITVDKRLFFGLKNMGYRICSRKT